MLTILTPTYNRLKTLKRLYKSLIQQTCFDFIWMIIDDGSEDDTAGWIKKISQDKKIKIQYYQKANGGKHTAINFGMKKINTELTMIVDSDDILVENAVEVILKDYPKWRDDNIASASYLKGKMYATLLGDYFPQDYFLSDHISYRINQKIKSDKAEVFKTVILKKYPFPEITGETFLSECLVWNRIAKEYKTLYINRLIYLCDYQPSGLTYNWRNINLRNPKGASLVANEMTTKEFRLSIRIRNVILYMLYGKKIPKTIKNLYQESLNKTLFIFCFPIGWIGYLVYRNR